MKNTVWVWLLGLEILMAVTHAGFLPVPGPGVAITLMHIPVILAAILSGPAPAAVVGLVFGVSSGLDLAQTDWMVLLPPRLLMGPLAGYAFIWARRKTGVGASISTGAFLAAVVGTLTNTLGITFLSALNGYPPLGDIAMIILLHGVPETVAAIVVTVPVAIACFYKR